MPQELTKFARCDILMASIKGGFVMTEYPMTPQNEFLPIEAWKARTKTTFNLVGWSLFALLGVWIGLTTVLSIAIPVISFFGIDFMPFYTEYMLVFNELFLALGIVTAMVILKPLAPYETKQKKISPLKIFKYFAIMFAIGGLGNFIANILLTVWNVITGNEAGGEVDDLLTGDSNFLMMVLMVGVVAPFLEEFFFRKLLIDRLRPFGELTCIATSAVLFGLFHGNFTQFFYAAGIGAFLGYLYYRSGNFILVFALHAAFNLLAGILPSIVFSMENTIPSTIYYIVYFAMILIGVICFLLSIFKFKPQKGEIRLPDNIYFASVIGNPGLIIAVLVMLFMMLVSLFTL